MSVTGPTLFSALLFAAWVGHSHAFKAWAERRRYVGA
jgi:hypothetical protein